MNKTKRGLQLGAAITSLAFSAFLTISGIYTLFLMLELVAGVPGASVVIISTILVILFAVAILVVSILVCVPPKGESCHKGKCITALVLNAVLAFIYLLTPSWYAIFPIICLGLFIATLCVKNTPVAQPVEQPTEQPKSE